MYFQVENNNYSNVNNNLVNLADPPAPTSPTLRVWRKLSKNMVGLHGLFVPTPRRYAAVPRTPTITDILGLDEAASVYRASRQVSLKIRFKFTQVIYVKLFWEHQGGN